MSYRRRFNLDEVLREWAAEQVATSRDQRDPRRSGEDTAAATEGAAEEDKVIHEGHVELFNRAKKFYSHIGRFLKV